MKTGLAPQVALHLAPEDAREVIREVAADATAHLDEIDAYVIQGPPYVQEVMIWARTDPTAYTSRGFQQTGARTFTLRAERIEDLYI